MNEPLHPLSLGEVLDRTAQLYRSRFLVYLGIGVVPAGTLLVFAALAFVLFAWAGSTVSDAATSGSQAVIAFLLLGLVAMVALPACLGTTSLGMAAMCHAAAADFLGQSISIRDAYRSAWKRGWRYVGLYLLLGLIIIVAPMVVLFTLTIFGSVLGALVAGVGFGFGPAANAALGFLVIALMFGLFGFAFWMLLRLCLSFPASVVEQIGPFSAMKRGSALSKGTRGRIFLLFLLGAALGWVLTLGTSIPILIAMALIPALNKPENSQMVGEIFLFIWYGLSFVVQAFTKPVYGIALTLFYFDQRIRTEGFDIEWMMAQAGMVVAPAQQQPEAVPWLPPVGQAMSQEALVETAGATQDVEQVAPEQAVAVEEHAVEAESVSRHSPDETQEREP